MTMSYYLIKKPLIFIDKNIQCTTKILNVLEKLNLIDCNFEICFHFFLRFYRSKMLLSIFVLISINIVLISIVNFRYQLVEYEFFRKYKIT